MMYDVFLLVDGVGLEVDFGCILNGGDGMKNVDFDVPSEGVVGFWVQAVQKVVDFGCFLWKTIFFEGVVEGVVCFPPPFTLRTSIRQCFWKYYHWIAFFMIFSTVYNMSYLLKKNFHWHIPCSRFKMVIVWDNVFGNITIKVYI